MDKKTILVVDDIPANLRLLVDALESTAYKVRVATSGKTALKSIKQDEPDLILLDVMMPELDGFETCQRLKEDQDTEDIPVIFMTALSDAVDEVRGLQLGAVDYITKPFQIQTVLARIETHLTMRQLQQDVQEKNLQLEQEIIERKRTEQKLRLTQFSIDQAADAIFWLNAEAEILYVNEMASQLLGYSAAELLTLTLFDIDPNYSAKVWAAHWQRTQQQAITVESRHQTKNGDIVPVEVTFTYLEFEGQTYNIAFAQDITWRRWATQELFAMEGRYQRLFEDAPISLWEEDWSAVKNQMDDLQAEGVTDFAAYFDLHPEKVQQCIESVQILDVNQATLKLHAATNKEQLTEGLQQLFGPETLKTFKQQLLAIVNTEDGFSGEVINYTLTGERKHFVLKQFVAPGYENTWERVLSALLDVSERKQAEEQLRQANKELDAFAHTVAHDLKSPLGIIIGYTDYLLELLPNIDEAELKDILKRICEVSYKGNNIVQELLLLAGVRKQEVSLRPIDMQQVISQVQQQLVMMIEEYQGEVVIPESWPTVLSYGPWLQEVWVNYISNALKYGGNPPRIELGATLQSDGMVRFWVRDNGPGLSPEAQAKLFAEFTRLDKIRAEGHGLGLSIVHRIMKKLGGDVGMESQVGQGNTFYFTLPLVKDLPLAKDSSLVQDSPLVQELPQVQEKIEDRELKMEDSK